MSAIYKSQPVGAALVLAETNKTSIYQYSFSDKLAHFIAVCGGIGYLPFVPGTWGSLIGIGFYLLAQKSGERFVVWAKNYNLTDILLETSYASSTLVFLIILFLTGTWAATRVVKLTGEKDPRIVVIDEVVGQLVTFLFVPAKFGWWTVIAGFFVFRIFDIWKPYPTNKFESLPTGLGVMADDAMAGFYAAAVMSVFCLFYLIIS